MKLRITEQGQNDFRCALYIIISAISIILAQLSLRGLIIGVGIMWICVIAADTIVDKIVRRTYKNAGMLHKTLTYLDEDGNYCLDATDLYEAIEKLGYLEHEQNR